MIAWFHSQFRSQCAFALWTASRRLTRTCTAILAIAVWTTSSGATAAHSFTAALLIVGDDQEERLAEAVRGFLLAADERDGHAAETSDGHLGGVDVHVLALPREATRLVEGLFGAPEDPPDIVVVIGPDPAATAEARDFEATSLILKLGSLPEGWEADAGADSFSTRYRRAHGAAPSEAAILAYHAARRLDVAIRPLDGVSPRKALEQALRATENGLPW